MKHKKVSDLNDKKAIRVGKVKRALMHLDYEQKKEQNRLNKEVVSIQMNGEQLNPQTPKTIGEIIKDTTGLIVISAIPVSMILAFLKGCKFF